MSLLLAVSTTHKIELAGWTAMEFYAALAPFGFAALADPATALAPVTLRAHVVAIKTGLSWSPAGRYPIRVWNQVLS